MLKDYEEGFALVMVLIMMSLVGILSVVMLRSISTHMNVAVHEEGMSQAFHSAEAGVEYVKANIDSIATEINNGEFDSIDEKDVDFDLDNIEFEITKDNEYEGEGVKLISLGKYNGYKERIEIKLKTMNPFTRTINTSKFKIGNYKNNYFDLQIESVEEADFHNNVDVTYNKDMSEEEWRNQAEAGDIFVKENDLNFGEINYKDFDFDETHVNVDDWISNGIYNLENKNVFIKLTNDFNIGGSDQIIISSDSETHNTLHLYVEGDEFDINGNAELKTEGNTSIVVYFNNDLKLNGTISGEIFFYGPDSKFELGGNATFTGAIVAKEVDTNGNVKINTKIPPSNLLSDKIVKTKFEVDNWRQLSN